MDLKAPMYAIAFVVVLIAAVFVFDITPIKPAPFESPTFKQFTSVDEFTSFVQSTQSDASAPYYSLGVERTDVVSAPSAAKSESAGSADTSYSTTNIQVAGVDEADVVKTDGQYLYTISGSQAVIINGAPAPDAQVVSTISFNGAAAELFINGNNLVVFGSEYATAPLEGDVVPLLEKALITRPYYPYYAPKTFVHVYDITDKANPVLKKNISLDGNYIDSRMIDRHVYVIVNQPFFLQDRNVVLPAFTENGVARSMVSDVPVYYSGFVEPSYQFTTVLSVDVVDSAAAVQSKAFLTGYTSNVYVSQNNIYVTSQRYLSYDMIFSKTLDALVTILPGDVASEISAIRTSSDSEATKYDRLTTVLQNYVNSLNTDQRKTFEEQVTTTSQQVQQQLSKEYEKTVVQRIAIKDGTIEHQATGEVPGFVLNQFSMDEHNTYFRVATTTHGYGSSDVQKNHVYVLDSSLSLVGSLEDLAPGERIYSARFLGDRVYLVTFQNIDPLFVIDLSNPSQPTVLGQLKIPGYSDYLHPYDDTHIIGIGKEAVVAKEGTFAWYQGLKLALFDVSDVTNPREVAHVTIGDRGSDSPVLYDHKAFLFDKEKGLLVIPVLEAKINASDYANNEVPEHAYGQYVFQGAYVFHLDLDTGFSLTGKVTHVDNETLLKSGYYFDSQFAVKRALYIGNVLYTLSDKLLKLNDLITLEELNHVKLPGFPDYPTYPVSIK